MIDVLLQPSCLKYIRQLIDLMIKGIGAHSTIIVEVHVHSHNLLTSWSGYNVSIDLKKLMTEDRSWRVRRRYRLLTGHIALILC